MVKILDDTINFGFGLFAYSREKIEKMVEALVDSGKVEKKDAQGFLKQMIQKGEDERAEVKKMVSDEVKSAVSAVTPNTGVTKEEIRQMIKEELANQQVK